MALLKKLLSLLKRQNKGQLPNKQTVEGIICDLYRSKGTEIAIKKISSEGFMKRFCSWEFGAAFNTLSHNSNAGIYCLKQIEALSQFSKAETQAPSPPLIENLFLLEEDRETYEYVLPFSCRIPFLFSRENRRDLLFCIESSRIFEIEENISRESYFFLIDNSLFSDTCRRMRSSKDFEKAVKQLVLGERAERVTDNALHVKIERPDEFFAGRFFLPKIVARKPQLTETRLHEIMLNSNKEQYALWKGLCFKISCQIDESEYTLYYLFDLITRDSSGFYTKLFTRFLKIVFQKSRVNYEACGMDVGRIKARVVDSPEPQIAADSVQLKYYMTSEHSMVHGRILIPLDLVSHILAKISPPWSIVFTMDSLLNRLKSFLSLNRELYSQGLISLAGAFRINLEMHSENPVLDLKVNFLKLHELLELLSLSEARSLVTDYLYRQGWSARKLKRIFYFSTKKDYSDQPGEILPLALFNEERFSDYLIRNMLDEWRHSNELGFKKEQEVSLEHFHILRELYEDRTYRKTIKLQCILEECFSQYYAAVDKIFESVKSDDSYTSHSSRHRRSLQRVFEDSRRIKSVFYYTPDHLSKFSGVLTDGKIDDIKNVEMDPPERLDDWMVSVFHFRNTIKNVTKNSREELYLK